jgi:hypothetical protein
MCTQRALKSDEGQVSHVFMFETYRSWGPCLSGPTMPAWRSAKSQCDARIRNAALFNGGSDAATTGVWQLSGSYCNLTPAVDACALSRRGEDKEIKGRSIPGRRGRCIRFCIQIGCIQATGVYDAVSLFLRSVLLLPPIICRCITSSIICDSVPAAIWKSNLAESKACRVLCRLRRYRLRAGLCKLGAVLRNSVHSTQHRNST